MLVHTIDKKLVLLIFAFFFIINLVTSGGHLDWWDGIEAFLVTESMVLKNTAKLDPSVPSVEKLGFNVNYTVYANKAIQSGNNSNFKMTPQEPVYTVRSILLSAIAIPFYHAGLFFSNTPITSIGLFANSLFISLTAIVIFCISVELNRSTKLAFALGLVFSVCSFVWPYNTTFWVQPLQGLLLISSMFFLVKARHHNGSFLCDYTFLRTRSKRFFLYGTAGVLYGISVFAHPASLIFLPAFTLYSYFSDTKRKGFILFASFLCVTLFFVTLTNYYRFGSFTEFGYGQFSSLATHNGWKGILGLLLSPGAGLLFYFPLSVLLPLAARNFYYENKVLFISCGYIIVSSWLYYGTLSFGAEPIAWSGGVAWGPRYLVPVLPFIMILLGSMLQHLRKKYFLKILAVSLCVVGFYVNMTGVLLWFQYGLTYGWDKQALADHPNSLEVMTWNPIYSPIVLHTKALIEDYPSSLDPTRYHNTAWNWIAYGTAPCSFDLYLYCTYGIGPVLGIFFVLAVLAVIIFKKLNLSTGHYVKYISRATATP